MRVQVVTVADFADFADLMGHGVPTALLSPAVQGTMDLV